jgi:hypothetical protein
MLLQITSIHAQIENAPRATTGRTFSLYKWTVSGFLDGEPVENITFGTLSDTAAKWVRPGLEIEVEADVHKGKTAYMIPKAIATQRGYTPKYSPDAAPAAPTARPAGPAKPPVAAGTGPIMAGSSQDVRVSRDVSIEVQHSVNAAIALLHHNRAAQIDLPQVKAEAEAILLMEYSLKAYIASGQLARKVAAQEEAGISDILNQTLLPAIGGTLNHARIQAGVSNLRLVQMWDRAGKNVDRLRERLLGLCEDYMPEPAVGQDQTDGSIACTEVDMSGCGTVTENDKLPF